MEVFKKSRFFILAAVFFFILFTLSPAKTTRLKAAVYSGLKTPIALSKGAAQTFSDIFYFKRNADELAALRHAIGQLRVDTVQTEELRLENDRLRRLVELKRSIPPAIDGMIFCRVNGKSPSFWSKTFLIDKGSEEGIRVNMLVLSELSVVGKVIEAGPHGSKVLFINDPNSRVGVLIQRTRQEGILYGNLAGECRVKYLSVEAPVKPGDIVETAGFGGFFPKGILIGKVRKAWKEPGQSYQVADVQPFSDFTRIEEVACVVPAAAP